MENEQKDTTGPKDIKSWYKKKRYIIPISIVILIIVLNLNSSNTDVSTKENCNPNYSGCLKPNASDYDCIGGSGNGPYYTGRVRVIGYDEYGLDRDHDGWGCEQ